MKCEQINQNERAQTNLGRHKNTCYCTVTLAHIFSCESNVLWRQILVIVAMLAKLVQICPC